MYENSRSQVQVHEGYNKEFDVKVGVQQDSELSPQLLIIVFKALLYEFCSGVLWEDLYADDLVTVADSMK